MKIPKELSKIAKWMTIATVVLALVNIVPRVFGVYIPYIDFSLVALGMLSVVLMAFTHSKFKFKSKMDLISHGTLLVLIMALLFIPSYFGMGNALMATSPWAMIYQAISPLLWGLFIGGALTFALGFLLKDN